MQMVQLMFNKTLCKEYSINKKPTSIKSPQSNAVLEYVHQVVGNMLHMYNLDDQEDWDAHDPFREILVGIAWAIQSMYHTMLGAMLGQIVFGWDMLFNIPFIYDLEKTCIWKQKTINEANQKENLKHKQHDYWVGDKVLITRDGILRKIEALKEGPYEIVTVYANGTANVQQGLVWERINICWLVPFHSSVGQFLD